ncbi:MAG TPA: hypothetical protein VG167_05560 [Verrucomicrobiae bacterium]|nr:hypothetical protein [Verrucomicrobiae bacterium]
MKASTPMPDDLQLLPANALPSQATWLSVKMWGEYPPSPYNWLAGAENVLYYRSATLGTNFVLIDDTRVDYAAQTMNASPMDASGPPMPGSGNDGGTNYGGGGFVSPKYTSSDIYLTITNLQTNYFGVAIHGVTNKYRGYWQLLSNPVVNLRPWGFGEIQTNTGSTNDLYFSPIADDKPMSYFWAAGGDNIASISGPQDATEPDSFGNGGIDGSFTVYLYDYNTNPVTVWYSMSGTALPGLDYSNYVSRGTGTFDVTHRVGSFTIDTGQQEATVTVHPLYDTNADFEEPAVFTLILTNGYLVDPSNSTATVYIRDNYGTNSYGPFSVVATNVPVPAGIDYHAPTHSLLIGVNFPDGEPNNFDLLGTNNVLTAWSGLHGVAGELKPFTAKSSLGGFTNGDTFFCDGTPGGIGWLSADGTASNLTWCTLTNETDQVQGSFYIDQTGTWSNHLLAVTADGPPQPGSTRGVWNIFSQTNPVQLTRINTEHLEGLLTVTNDPAYGPFAGSLLTADEDNHLIYAVQTNGSWVSLPLGINADQFRLIPTNQDLYCVLYADGAPAESMILKLSRTYFAGHQGDILIEESGEVFPGVGNLYILHWDTVNNGPHFWRIGLPSTLFGHFEGVTFAPIDIPPIPQ